MYRNFKVCVIGYHTTPFIKGDLRKSPLIKGARGLSFASICRVYKKSLPKAAWFITEVIL